MTAVGEMLKIEPAVGEVLTIEVATAAGEKIARNTKVRGSNSRRISSPLISS